MLGRLIVITGTGTGIGKTHVARALLTRANRTTVACGFKPIESGASGERGPDGAALLAASHPTFHVKPPISPYVFRDPVSPHLAARREGHSIDLATVQRSVTALREHWPAVVVELAGGLFSPLIDRATNADLLTALAPDRVLLVAPDRLGVLHDLGATVRAARSEGITARAVALVAPADPDDSTGTNARECETVMGLSVHSVPRGSVDELALSTVFDALYAALV